MVIVVEKNQIKVGGIAKLFAAEAAVRYYGEVRFFPVPFSKRAPDRIERHLQNSISHCREVI